MPSRRARRTRSFSVSTTGTYTLQFQFTYGNCDLCYSGVNNPPQNPCAARTSQIGFSGVGLRC